MQNLNITDLSILLLEPSLAQSKIIVSELKQNGINNIDPVFTIPEALEKLNHHKPDLVISAMYFKEGTGADFLLSIRNNKELESIPFLLISSEKKFEYIDPLKQAGVVAILNKPFTAKDLQLALISTLDYLEENELDLDAIDIAEVRVLVVDDSLMARKHISRVLTNLGITKISQVEDGSEAIEALKDNEFDLVVTDYNMPNVNGGELLKHIRTESSQAYIPVMVVTSEQNSAVLSSIEQSGSSALCDKPFDSLHVKRLLAQILQ